MAFKAGGRRGWRRLLHWLRNRPPRLPELMRRAQEAARAEYECLR